MGFLSHLFFFNCYYYFYVFFFLTMLILFTVSLLLYPLYFQRVLKESVGRLDLIFFAIMLLQELPLLLLYWASFVNLTAWSSITFPWFCWWWCQVDNLKNTPIKITCHFDHHSSIRSGSSPKKIFFYDNRRWWWWLPICQICKLHLYQTGSLSWLYKFSKRNVLFFSWI